MKISVKITAFCICAFMLTQTAACGGDVKTTLTTDTTTDSAQTETTSLSETNLPDTNWGGREFRVLGYENTARTQFSNFEVYSDGENGDVVNDAVFRRNQAIEEKYNVKITQTLNDNSDWGIATSEYLRQTIMAQEDLYDLAFCNINNYGTLAREGLLFDLNNVDYIDFTRSYWNSEVNNALSYDNKLFFTSSDFSLRDKNRAYILLYNREMAETYGLGNAAELVRDGTWTFDTMTQWSKTVSSDLNGNGIVDDEDMFGIAMDSYNAFSALMVACKNIILTKTNGDLYDLKMNNEHTINSIDKVLALTGSENEAIFCDEWNGKVDYDFWSVSSNVFDAGHSLFISTFPHSLKDYSADCDFEYGIIPFPKYDEEQENYYTMADIYCMLFGIPVTNPDPDFTGFMLEALSAASTDTTLEAYYEISCKTKYTYDEESAEMLDLIFENIVYEPARVYGVGDLTAIYSKIAASKTNNFATLYASNESAALADLDKLSEDLGGTD